jgi:peptide-methionine (S)-S-oxide reductase
MQRSTTLCNLGKSFVGFLLLALVLEGIKAMSAAQTPRPGASETPSEQSVSEPRKKPQTATFGAGCFWCTEAVFQRLKGVQSVVSGYSGGHVKNPTYKQVSSSRTGHAEAVQITFDPDQISYAELLEVFWKTHDPTTLNRQGPDIGTQYRSIIFYHNDEQKQLAEKCKRELDQSKAFRAPIVTQLVPFQEFFPAENYHQDYYELNSRQPYCATIIRPKVEKLEKVFGDKLKSAPAESSASGKK